MLSLHRIAYETRDEVAVGEGGEGAEVKHHSTKKNVTSKPSRRMGSTGLNNGGWLGDGCEENKERVSCVVPKRSCFVFFFFSFACEGEGRGERGWAGGLARTPWTSLVVFFVGSIQLMRRSSVLPGANRLAAVALLRAEITRSALPGASSAQSRSSSRHEGCGTYGSRCAC